MIEKEHIGYFWSFFYAAGEDLITRIRYISQVLAETEGDHQICNICCELLAAIILYLQLLFDSSLPEANP